MSFVTTRYASPQAQQRGQYREVNIVDNVSQEAALETYRALPAPDHVYSDYDFEIIAEIITLAEQQAQALARKGKGLGEVTLQRLLKAYEQVLPRYQVKPQEDIYYYRFLLKLSLDPDPNWWAKFYRECQAHGGSAAVARPAGTRASQQSGNARAGEWSPSRQARSQARPQQGEVEWRDHAPIPDMAAPPNAGYSRGASASSFSFYPSAAVGSAASNPSAARPYSSGRVAGAPDHGSAGVGSSLGSALPTSSTGQRRPGAAASGQQADAAAASGPGYQPLGAAGTGRAHNSSTPAGPSGSGLRQPGSGYTTYPAPKGGQGGEAQSGGESGIARDSQGLPNSRRSAHDQHGSVAAAPGSNRAARNSAFMPPYTPYVPAFDDDEDRRPDLSGFPGASMTGQPGNHPNRGLPSHAAGRNGTGGHGGGRDPSSGQSGQPERRAYGAHGAGLPSDGAGDYGGSTGQPPAGVPGQMGVGGFGDGSGSGGHVPGGGSGYGARDVGLSADGGLPSGGRWDRESNPALDPGPREAAVAATPGAGAWAHQDPGGRRADASANAGANPGYGVGVGGEGGYGAHPGADIGGGAGRSSSAVAGANPRGIGFGAHASGGIPGGAGERNASSTGFGAAPGVFDSSATGTGGYPRNRAAAGGPVSSSSAYGGRPGAGGRPEGAAGEGPSNSALAMDFSLPEDGPSVGSNSHAGIRELMHRRGGSRNLGAVTPHPGSGDGDEGTSHYPGGHYVDAQAGYRDPAGRSGGAGGGAYPSGGPPGGLGGGPSDRYYLAGEASEDGGSTGSGTSQGSEADAYLDFQRTAKSFRTWRDHTFILRESRAAREEAVANWNVALAFWELHLVHRCFRYWLNRKPEALALVLQQWRSSSLRACFNRWKEITKYLKAAGFMSSEFSVERYKRKCLTWWRIYTEMRRVKDSKVLKALSFWTGNTLKAVFLAWRILTEQAIQSGHHADSYYEAQASGKLLLLWRAAAKQRRQLRQAEAAIRMALHGRLAARCLTTWHTRWQTSARHRQLLGRAVAGMKNRALRRAFVSLHDYVGKKQQGRERIAHALGHWHNARLTTCWNSWQDYLDSKRSKRGKMQHALAFMTNRSQAQAWQSWVQLVREARDNMQLAREHFREHGTPMQQGFFLHWRVWHQEHATKAERLAELQAQLADCKKHRIMQVWHKAAEQRKQDLAAFDLIVKREVRRVSTVACQAIARVCRNHSLIRSAATALTESSARRVLREWRAVARMRHQRRRRWTLLLDRAQTERRRRVLLAFRLVTAIRAEQRLLVLSHLDRRRRVVKAAVLGVLKLHVRSRVRKRASLLKALMHWDLQAKARALSGWVDRLLVGRGKRAKLQRAQRHHRTRVLQRTFRFWLAVYQVVQEKTAVALMHWTGREDLFLHTVLHAWRDVARVRAVKSNKVRLAVAHWMGNRLAWAFYSWHDAAQKWMLKEAKMRVALAKWTGNYLYKAFAWWKEWALRKVLLNRKARAYLALLLGRAAAFAFFMLRSNAVRKRKSQGAYLHRRRMILRTALQGWKLRVFLSGEMEGRLQAVFHKMLGDSLRAAFDSWQLALAEGAHKRQLMGRALQLWSHRRQAAAFRAIRSYQLRKQMSRALLLKYRVGLAAVVMREWRAEAKHRAACKAKVMGMLYRTERQVLRHSMDAWHEWIHLKHEGLLQKSRAEGHLFNTLLGRAWNSWMDYHERMHVARRALLHMMQLRMGQAFNAWWGTVLNRREVMQKMEGVVARMHNKKLVQAFNMLRAQVERRQLKRMADAHYYHKRFRIIFHAWRLGAKLEMALNLWTGNVLALTFGQWRGLVQEKRRLRLTGEQVARRWRNLELATAFRTWIANVDAVASERHAISRAVLHWRNGQLAAAFGAWRWYMSWKWRMRETARAVTARMAGGAKLRAFNSWRCFMALQARKAMAFRHADINRMRRAFLPWLQQTSSKVAAADRAEQLFEQITTALAADTLSAVFAAWRHHVRTMPRLRAILARVLGRHLSLAFGGWRDVSADEKQQRQYGAVLEEKLAGRPILRQRCIAAVNRWASWPLSYAFDTWLSRVQEHKDLQHRATLAVFSYAGSLLRKAWVAWRGYSTAKAGVQKRMVEALAAMGAMRLARSFYWWLTLAKYLAHMKVSVAAIQDRITFRIKAGVWQAWQQRVHYSRVGRKALARLAMRTQLAVLHQWQACARHRAEQRAKVRLSLGKLMNRSMAAAFATWCAWAQHRARLHNIQQQALGKLMHGNLAQAWAGWVSFMELNAAKKEKMAAVAAHWGSNMMRKAFNTWRAAWEEAARGTLAAVHYFGRLQDRCWLAWREAVAEAELTRGNSKWRHLVAARVLACWRAYVHAARVERQAVIGLSTLVVCQKLLEWRHLTRARMAMRRLYMRRALLGWCMRTIQRQQQREQLRHVAQVLLFGMLARCFSSWLAFVREQAAKRVVFAQKQSALQEALRFGERLRQRHNAELLSTAFHAWHLKTGIFRQVAMRFAQICHRTVSACFLMWHAYVVERRHRLHTALEHRRLKVLRHTFVAWSKKAHDLHQMAVLFAGLAEEHWYVSCASKVLRVLREAADLGMARRQALRKVFERKLQADNQDLLSRTFAALHAFMARKLDLYSLADMASKSRSKRVLADALNVWHTYTVAMRSDLDPDSPFLSPRSKKDNRQLIRNVATFVGSPEAEAISEGSSHASLDEADRMHEVMTRRDAYLRIASPPRSGRPTGVSAESSMAGNTSFRSSVSFTPRTTVDGAAAPPAVAAVAAATVPGLRGQGWRDDRGGMPLEALYQPPLSPEMAPGGRARVGVHQGVTPPQFRGFGSELRSVQRAVTLPSPSAARSMATPASVQQQYMQPQSQPGYPTYGYQGPADSQGPVLLTAGWPAGTPAPAGPSRTASQSSGGGYGPSSGGSSILARAAQLQAASGSRRGGSSLLMNAQALAARGQPGMGY